MNRFIYITIITIVFFSLPGFSFSQARVMINNNAYVRLNGGTAGTPIYLVVDNGNTDAVSTLGTGGNLVSEGEWNILRWNISTNTGTYVVPFTSNPATTNFKYPLSVQITGGGTGAGRIQFSSYETTTDMNIPWASIVTHMTDADNAPADNSLNVVDRYWIINALGYTAKPDVNMTIGYVDNATELSGTNTITEANLVAQRWNSGINEWEGDASNAFISYGAANTAANHVSNINITPAEFFEVWVLVDNASLLPVELTSMDATCKENQILLEWSTASETNSDNYSIEVSYDGINYFVFDEINAAGNSASTTSYSTTIPGNLNLQYARIKQNDQNGQFVYFPVITLPSCSEENVQIFSDSDFIYLNYNSADDDDLVFEIYSTDGKLIAQNIISAQEGNNHWRFNNELATGIYFATVKNQEKIYSNKLFIKK